MAEAKRDREAELARLEGLLDGLELAVDETDGRPSLVRPDEPAPKAPAVAPNPEMLEAMMEAF